MNNRSFIILSLLLVVVSLPVHADDYTLFRRSRSIYSIIVSKNASPSEKFAADELQKYLYEISGYKLPIMNVNQGKKGSRIIVGFNSDAQSCLPGLEKPSPEDQSFRYFNSKGDIVIVGGSDIGTLYGVYNFLERELDCRWLTSQVSDIPKKSSWSFSSLDYTESPAFDYRFLYSKGAFDKLWAMRNQNNGRPDSYKTKYGDIGYPQFPFWGVHTFNKFVPPSKYFSRHPEYYSLIKGKRDSKQLCLTNETVKQLCINALRDVIKSAPDYKVFDLSQNDNINSCECRKCSRIKKRYGSESGLILWFVNQVAQALKNEFPDKYIGTLAYQFSQKAPTSIAPDENVVVRLSVINTCLIHGLDDCEKNRSAAQDVKDWSKLTNNLFVWDYISTSRIYYTPFPNFEAIKKRLEYYQKCGVRGVLIEGNASVDNGEFAGLRAYVISKLLWNPSTDLDMLVNDYISRYYGKASSYIRQYYDLTQKRASLKDNHMFFVMDHKNKVYSSDYLKQAYSLLSEAENKSDNNQIRQRVSSEKMSVAYMLCKVSPGDGVKMGALDFVKRWSSSNKIESFAGYGENADKQKFFDQMKAYE